MRAVWIDEPTDVQSWDAMHQLLVTHIYYSERVATKNNMDLVRSHGMQFGIYSNPQWYGFEDPKLYRDRVNKKLQALAGIDGQCDVQFNIEKTAFPGSWDQAKQNQYVIDLFYWWRRARRTRLTSWTMEGFQGGWFYPAMNHPNLLGDPLDGRTVTSLAPQAYDGSMNRWDSYGCVGDLVAYGVAFNRVVPMYDAPELRIRGSFGYFYLEHRLYQ